MRSEALTLPGYVHDVCSGDPGHIGSIAVLPELDLARHGLELIHPTVPLAHPFDDGSAAILERSVAKTAASLGEDGPAYQRLFQPLIDEAGPLMALVLGPVTRPPRHPVLAMRFGLPAMRSATGLARARFRGDPARALLTGLSAHSMVALERPLTAAFGLVLGVTAHAYGWPLVRGGTGNLAAAMAAELRSLGGEIVTDHPISTIAELPPARAILFDTSPQALSAIAGERLPVRYRRRIEGFRYGPGRGQGGLGTRRTHTVASRTRPRGRHCPRRGHARGSRVRRVGGGRRSPPRAPIRARGPAEPVRRDPGTGGSCTPAGRTATCPTDRPWTYVNASRPRSSGSRRAFGTGSWSAPFACP